MLRVPQGCWLAQRSHAAKQVNPVELGIKLNIAGKAIWFCLRRRSGCPTVRVNLDSDLFSNLLNYCRSNS
jgi:hypothetical protein